MLLRALAAIAVVTIPAGAVSAQAGAANGAPSAPVVAQALTLGAPFTDGVVLQRGVPLRLWGTARPKARLVVTLGAASVNAVAGRDGRWQASLPAVQPGLAGDLVVTSGADRAVAHNVAVGDVFLCSGQSNMEFTMAETVFQPGQRQSPLDAQIRLFKVAHLKADAPRSTFEQQPVWQVATATGKDFSSVCLLFGRAVARDYKVPVGLIGASWGGTPIQAWQARPLAAYVNPGRADARHADMSMYNAMIAPLGPMPLAGVLWYQGENNAGQGDSVAAYRARLEAMMADWRGQFGPKLPFIIMQLAGFGPGINPARDTGWSQVREAQRQVAEADPLAALVVTIDVGERLDIHPPLKLPVAQRAYGAARAIIYGEGNAPSGPRATTARLSGDRIVVDIADAKGTLIARDWGRPGPVQLCGGAEGNECRFVDADLSAGSSIIAPIPAGFVPTRIRYCWGGAPACNVEDAAQLPLGPFELDVPVVAAAATTGQAPRP